MFLIEPYNKLLTGLYKRLIMQRQSVTTKDLGDLSLVLSGLKSQDLVRNGIHRIILETLIDHHKQKRTSFFRNVNSIVEHYTTAYDDIFAYEEFGVKFNSSFEATAYHKSAWESTYKECFTKRGMRPVPFREFFSKNFHWLLQDPVNLVQLIYILAHNQFNQIEFDAARKANTPGVV